MADSHALEMLRKGAAVWNRWRGTTRFAAVDLVNADLGGMKLNDYSLVRADLTGANLTRTQLEHVHLKDANLTGLFWRTPTSKGRTAATPRSTTLPRRTPISRSARCEAHASAAPR